MYFWDAQDLCQNFVHIRWHMNLYKVGESTMTKNLSQQTFNAILPSETIALREPLWWDTIVTIHCPTALDLEFKQPSKTFYIILCTNGIYARLQDPWDLLVLSNNCEAQWFLSPPSFWQVRQHSSPGRALEEVDLHQQNESSASLPLVLEDFWGCITCFKETNDFEFVKHVLNF